MIENEYRLDLREKPVGQLLGQGRVVGECPKCKRGGFLFKRKTARNGSRTETWLHEIHITLDARQQPQLNSEKVLRCEMQLAAENAA